MNFQEKASFFPTFKKLKLIKFQSISVGTQLKENIKNRHQPVKNYIMKSDIIISLIKINARKLNRNVSISANLNNCQ